MTTNKTYQPPALPPQILCCGTQLDTYILNTGEENKTVLEGQCIHCKKMHWHEVYAPEGVKEKDNA